MINEVIKLCPDDPNVTLTTYVQNEGWKKRDAILVIPGGGYGCICDDREGEPIALAYAAKGVNAFVLRYSVLEKAKFPRPLIEASLAIAYIRDHAEEFHIDPERVFCVGFSAGGHLAASLGTLWHLPEIYEATGMEYGHNRPTGMILCYAVLSTASATHLETFCRAIGSEHPTEAELKKYSVEQNIDERTAPAFFMHTSNDQAVPVANALTVAMKMAEKGMKFELHVYPNGPHGVALGDWQTGRGNDAWVDEKVARWIDDSIYWSKSINSHMGQ